jgi:hypothetical protein
VALSWSLSARSLIASVQPAGSSAGATRAFSPCRRYSAEPPVPDATTGTPAAIASSGTLPHGSAQRTGKSTASARCSSAIAPDRSTGGRTSTRSPRPNASTSVASSSSSAGCPDPTMRSEPASSPPSARTAVSTPLSASIRPRYRRRPRHASAARRGMASTSTPLCTTAARPGSSPSATAASSMYRELKTQRPTCSRPPTYGTPRAARTPRFSPKRRSCEDERRKLFSHESETRAEIGTSTDRRPGSSARLSPFIPQSEIASGSSSATSRWSIRRSRRSVRRASARPRGSCRSRHLRMRWTSGRSSPGTVGRVGGWSDESTRTSCPRSCRQRTNAAHVSS